REGVDGAGRVERRFRLLPAGEAVELDPRALETEGEGAAVGRQREGADAARREGTEAVAFGAPDQRPAPRDGDEGAPVGRGGERLDGILARDAPGSHGSDAARGRLARRQNGEAPVAVDDGEGAAARRERERGHAAVLGARDGGERRRMRRRDGRAGGEVVE